MIINRRHLTKKKLEKLKSGYSVYSENQEAIEYLEKRIAEEGIKVIVDRTPIGTWFIPEENRSQK